ncbi:hypothetical protein Ancab_018935 [Ancistrocladus abbreviatus]
MILILYLSINLPHSEVLIKPSSFLSTWAISLPNLISPPPPSPPPPPPPPPPASLPRLPIFESPMSLFEDSNPHFRPRSRLEFPSQYDQPSAVQPRIQPRQRPGQAQPQPMPPTGYQPVPYQTPPQRSPRQTPQPQLEIVPPLGQPEPIQQPRQSPQKPPPQTVQPHRQPPPTQAQNEQQNLKYPSPRKTKPLAWFGVVFCVILWIVIILGGLLVLIIYLVFRPRNPNFGIMTATLNSAYLDMGSLLNADLTLLVNFTNPSSKVNVDFNYVILQLYYKDQLIANQYIEPFSAMRAESRLAYVEMVSSQVRLPVGVSEELLRQIENNRIAFEVEGPPSGSIVTSKCRTKR